MARGVAVQLGTRTPIRLSPATVIILIFAGVLIYIIYAGSDESKAAGGGGTSSSGNDPVAPDSRDHRDQQIITPTTRRRPGREGQPSNDQANSSPYPSDPRDPRNQHRPRTPPPREPYSRDPQDPETPAPPAPQPGPVAAPPQTPPAGPQPRPSNAPPPNGNGLWPTEIAERYKLLPPGLDDEERANLKGLRELKTAKPTRSALKGGWAKSQQEGGRARNWAQPNQPGHGLDWVDQTHNVPLTRTHSSNLMEGDYREEIGGMYNPNGPKKPSGPKPKGPVGGRPTGPRAMYIDYDQQDFSATSLFEGEVDEGLQDYLESVERVAKRETRFHPLRADDIPRMLGPRTRAELVERNVDPRTVFNPMDDDWDEVWGTLPRVALDAARTLASKMNERDIEGIEVCMGKRKKFSEDDPQKRLKRDEHRTWRGFANRAAPGSGQQRMSAERLCIGWFADTYRCEGGSTRMIVSNDEETAQSISMTKRLGMKVTNILRFLEALGSWMRRQRVFTSSGIDLAGNCGRIAVNIVNIGENIEYEYSMTIFLWTEAEDFLTWTQRASSTYQALVALKPRLVQGIDDLRDTLQASWKRPLGTTPVGSKLIFRPGFTVHQVNVSRGNTDEVDHQAAHNVTLDRTPKPMIYAKDSEDVWEEVQVRRLTMLTRQKEPLEPLLALLAPQEVIIINMRQYQWDTRSLQPGHVIQRHHLLYVLYSMGPLVNIHGFEHPELVEDNKGVSSVEILDLTCFLPLVRRKGTSGPNLQYDFFPLSDFYHLMRVIIPYTEPNREPGKPGNIPSTYELIVDKTRGLQAELYRRNIVVEGKGQVDQPLQLYITFRDSRQLATLKSQLVAYVSQLARHEAVKTFHLWQSRIDPSATADGGAALKARANAQGKKFAMAFCTNILNNVYSVNTETQKKALKLNGQLNGASLDLVPQFPEDLLN